MLAATLRDPEPITRAAAAANHQGINVVARKAPLLEAQGVSKTYTTRSREKVAALGEVSLALDDGAFVSLVGPSGCGKSTLLKMVAGIVPPSAGELRLNGKRVSGGQAGMGVVFQSPVLLPWLTVLDNTLLPAKVLKLDRQQARTRALELLRSVGLEGFEHKYPGELSGGMQQRVSIIRSLVHEPGLLLMDEPFGALDALTRENMSLDLQRIWLAHKKTVLFITHSIFEAVFLSDRVLVMSERPGRIVRDLAIPFARPRSFDLTTTPEFGEIVQEIRGLLGATAHA
ncbi:ABC transporter ATP-binding protein [Xenophilus azovorans]|uniref:ABC transporter ATP-binding protein n=1 Tax=Xenophilus azovorans TaxID=151755 RepID=UPI0009FC63E7|nr:ABC transporter ATP-binding protein [Xenophilus azovorans]